MEARSLLPLRPGPSSPHNPMKLASPIAVLACTFPLFAAPWSMANAQTAQVDFPAPAQTSYAVEFDEAGGGFAAFNDNLDLVVLAFAPDGAILWQRRVADPIGFPSPSFRPLMVSVPEGGVLVIANDHVVRLGSDGSVLAAREMPSDFVAAAAMCRLNDGRILVGKLVPNFFPGFDTSVRLLELDPFGNPLGQRALSALYPNPAGTWNAASLQMTATADGGWVMAYGAQSSECCDGVMGVSRHDSMGAVRWITMLKNVSTSSDLVELASGPIALTTSATMYLFSASGSLLSSRLFTTSAGLKGIAGVGATPDGGLVGVCSGLNTGPNDPSTLWRLDAQLNVVFARDLAVRLIGPVELATGPQGHISLFARSHLSSRLVRTGAEGAWYGACAPLSVPGFGALTTVSSPSLLATQASLGSSPIAPTNAVTTAAADAGKSPLTVCADPRPRLVPTGGQVGFSLAFEHQQPGAPGGLSALILSATGLGALPLPGQLDAGIHFDGVTDWVLSSGLGFAFLDQAGDGSSAPIPVPNNPGLIGFPLTYGGVAVTAAGDILQATLPRSLLLQ